MYDNARSWPTLVARIAAGNFDRRPSLTLQKPGFPETKLAKQSRAVVETTLSLGYPGEHTSSNSST